MKITNSPRPHSQLSGMILQRSGRSTLTLALIATTLASFLFIPGCGEDDATERVITKASAQLSSLTAGSDRTAFTSPQFSREKVFASVISELMPIAGSDSSAKPSQQAVAAIIIAHAQMGLAEIPAVKAVELEHQASKMDSLLAEMLRDWQKLEYSAAATAQYDPSKQLAELDQLAAMRAQEIADTQTRRDELSDQIAKLQAHADQLAEQSRKIRLTGSDIRRQAADAEPAQAAALVQQARVQIRKADALQVQSSKTLAQIATMTPQLSALETEITKLTNQRELIFKGKAEINKKTESVAAQTAAARQQASELADQIHALFSKAQELRNGELDRTTREAIKGGSSPQSTGFQGAARMAGKAVNESRTTGNLAKAQAQQSLGDVLWTSAQGHSQHASILELLAHAQGLDSGDYANAAQESRNAQAQALEAAKSAYNTAQRGYAGAGVRGEAGQRLKAVSDALSAVFESDESDESDETEQPEEQAVPSDETP